MPPVDGQRPRSRNIGTAAARVAGWVSASGEGPSPPSPSGPGSPRQRHAIPFHAFAAYTWYEKGHAPRYRSPRPPDTA